MFGKEPALIVTGCNGCLELYRDRLLAQIPGCSDDLSIELNHIRELKLFTPGSGMNSVLEIVADTDCDQSLVFVFPTERINQVQRFKDAAEDLVRRGQPDNYATEAF